MIEMQSCFLIVMAERELLASMNDNEAIRSARSCIAKQEASAGKNVSMALCSHGKHQQPNILRKLEKRTQDSPDVSANSVSSMYCAAALREHKQHQTRASADPPTFSWHYYCVRPAPHLSSPFLFITWWTSRDELGASRNATKPSKV